MFEKLHGPKRIFLSNGDSTVFAERRVILERARWFDRWLKGEQNGIDKEPPVTVWFETRSEQRPTVSPSVTVPQPLQKSPRFGRYPSP